VEWLYVRATQKKVIYGQEKPRIRRNKTVDEETVLLLCSMTKIAYLYHQHTYM